MIRSYLTDSASYYAMTGSNSDGQPTYGDAVTIPILMGKTRQLMFEGAVPGSTLNVTRRSAVAESNVVAVGGKIVAESESYRIVTITRGRVLDGVFVCDQLTLEQIAA